jgi:hypothetical protein
MKSLIALFILGMAVAFAAFAIAAYAHAQPMPPRGAPPPPPGYTFGDWLAAPFNAIGHGIGAVAAGVGNVVETPFIAVGQAWGNNNCWRKMVDPRDGQTKLMWICR